MYALFSSRFRTLHSVLKACYKGRIARGPPTGARLAVNTLASFFLRAKHWQIFVLLVGVGFVGDIVLLIYFPAAGSGDSFGRFELLDGILTAIFLVLFLGWLWAMGSFLSSIVIPKLRLDTELFLVSLIYPPLYIFAFFAVIFGNVKSPLIVLILPFHLFAMFCIFYWIYFVSKSLVLAETGRPASFYDYAGPFFLIWFFPIGIWFTQLRINRLYAERAKTTPIPSVTAS